MEVINEELRVYRIDPGELTIGQIKTCFRSWEDDEKIGGFMALYDKARNRLLFGPNADEHVVQFGIKALSTSPERALERLNELSGQWRTQGCREFSDILKCVIIHRREMERSKTKEVTVNPNTRFISVDGDIFQISKIVSVKRRDSGGRYYIEFYITNKRASVTKEFSSKNERDFEYSRVQKILESAA